jgi:hypothetical protein
MAVPILTPKQEIEATETTPKAKVSIVDETNIGLYIWMLPTGEPLADEDANFLAIPAKRGDKKRMKLLADTANSYGYPDGEAVFYAGSRRISDDEFWHQVDNIMNGRVPDDYDIPALMGEIEAKQSGLGY